MKKIVWGIIAFIISFIGMMITNISWLVILLKVDVGSLPIELQMPFNVLSAVHCVAVHIAVYILMYKKYFYNKLNTKMYIGICVSPYIILLLLTVYFFATFPLT